MLLLACVFVLLFAGLPAVTAYMTRVEPASGFGLRAPRLLPLVGALMLGLSLWPFILELIQLQDQVGFATMPAAVRLAARAAVERWQASPWLVLFAMAVVPGLVEEFFFRGCVFSALARITEPWLAIFASALVFGVFHIFPSGVFAAERLLPSTLMGLVLGWVRWRTGSIWPCVLLHVAHNSLLLSAGLFPELLGPDVAEGTGHLPPTLLIGAVPLVLFGAAAVWWGTRKDSL